MGKPSALNCLLPASAIHFWHVSRWSQASSQARKARYPCKFGLRVRGAWLSLHISGRFPARMVGFPSCGSLEVTPKTYTHL